MTIEKIISILLNEAEKQLKKAVGAKENEQRTKHEILSALLRMTALLIINQLCGNYSDHEKILSDYIETILKSYERK